jgi:hypothetical protein
MGIITSNGSLSCCYSLSVRHFQVGLRFGTQCTYIKAISDQKDLKYQKLTYIEILGQYF